MDNKDEIVGLLKQYNNMCDEYDKRYKRMRDDIDAGRLDKIEYLKDTLRQINAIIVNLQLRLDTCPNISGYNPEEGYNRNVVTEKIDDLVDKFISHSQGMKTDDETNKYENDGMSDQRKIPVEDAERAAIAWGEEYEPLIDFLENCIKSEIQTFGCCAGHKESDIPYVLFDADDNRVIELAEYLSENKIGLRIDAWHNNETGKNLLGIYFTMDQRENAYTLCNKFIKEKKREDSKIEEKHDSMLRNLVNIIHNGGYNLDVIYWIQDEIFHIKNGFNAWEYTTDELEKAFELGQKRITTRKKSVIDSIKERCESSSIGLEKIMSIRSLFTRKREDRIKERGDEEI